MAQTQISPHWPLVLFLSLHFHQAQSYIPLCSTFTSTKLQKTIRANSFSPNTLKKKKTTQVKPQLCGGGSAGGEIQDSDVKWARVSVGCQFSMLSSCKVYRLKTKCRRMPPTHLPKTFSLNLTSPQRSPSRWNTMRGSPATYHEDSRSYLKQLSKDSMLQAKLHQRSLFCPQNNTLLFRKSWKGVIISREWNTDFTLFLLDSRPISSPTCVYNIWYLCAHIPQRNVQEDLISGDYWLTSKNLMSSQKYDSHCKVL